MYTAVQALNISAEKQNHYYYRVYKKRVKSIMQRISFYANHGYIGFRFMIWHSNREDGNVLQQIAYELNLIGYMCTVGYEKNKHGKKCWYIDVKWRE